MNYLSLNQCKKLKELGYEDSSDHVWVVYNQTPKLVTQSVASTLYENSKVSGWDFDSFNCPALEELIDWLPFGLSVHKSDDDSGTAVYMNTVKKGETPLEAVYNLAVAIKS